MTPFLHTCRPTLPAPWALRRARQWTRIWPAALSAAWSWPSGRPWPLPPGVLAVTAGVAITATAIEMTREEETSADPTAAVIAPAAVR